MTQKEIPVADLEGLDMTTCPMELDSFDGYVDHGVIVHKATAQRIRVVAIDGRFMGFNVLSPAGEANVLAFLGGKANEGAQS